MKKIILGSSSIRRKALLSQIGLIFEIEKPEIDEKLNPRLKPKGNVENISLLKANAIYEKLKLKKLLNTENRIRNNEKNGYIIITADTFVVFDGEIIGKPEDKKKAKKVLSKLSGKSHTVVTGFTILDTSTKKTITRSVDTKVSFRKLSLKEIDSYIKTGEPMDKAGGYGMQGLGAIFVESIEGDPFNVVGLPLQALSEELKKFGIKCI